MTTRTKLFMVYPALMVMCLPGGKPGTSTYLQPTAKERENIYWFEKRAQAEFEAERAALRSSCLKAKTELLRDCKDLSAPAPPVCYDCYRGPVRLLIGPLTHKGTVYELWLPQSPNH